MGDDVVVDDVMKWDRRRIDNRGNYSFRFTGWPCNEDRPGTDEIYVRVRVEGYSPAAGGWIKSSWANGTRTSGSCS